MLSRKLLWGVGWRTRGRMVLVIRCSMVGASCVWWPTLELGCRGRSVLARVFLGAVARLLANAGIAGIVVVADQDMDLGDVRRQRARPSAQGRVVHLYTAAQSPKEPRCDGAMVGAGGT